MYYNLLRQKNFENIEITGGVKVLPVTTRTLETVIRLATAHAKLRLSNKITIADCKVATGLLNYALFSKEDAIVPDELEEGNVVVVTKVENRTKTKNNNDNKKKSMENEI